MSSDDRKPPSTRGSVGKQIENLACLVTVDVMLLENTPLADVAKFIQQDQGELKDVPEKTLANALGVRRLQRIEVDGYYGIGQAGLDTDALDDSVPGKEGELLQRGGYKRPAVTPGSLVKNLYKRADGGIQHMLELEALYLASRDRVDRWMELESEVGGFSDKCGPELVNASKILMEHFEVAQALGLVESGERLKVSLDIRRYSERTAIVLSKPESRHRVVSLIERLVKHASRPATVVEVSAESRASIPLPMPKASGDNE